MDAFPDPVLGSTLFTFSDHRVAGGFSPQPRARFSSAVSPRGLFCGRIRQEQLLDASRRGVCRFVPGLSHRDAASFPGACFPGAGCPKVLHGPRVAPQEGRRPKRRDFLGPRSIAQGSRRGPERPRRALSACYRNYRSGPEVRRIQLPPLASAGAGSPSRPCTSSARVNIAIPPSGVRGHASWGRSHASSTPLPSGSRR